jgi:hypothetical protein
LSVRWLRPGGKHRPQELADAYIAICMEGFAVEGPRPSPRRSKRSKQALDRP